MIELQHFAPTRVALDLLASLRAEGQAIATIDVQRSLRCGNVCF